MARRDHSLKIIPFKNRSGTMSFRLTGTILGMRVQKNFSTVEAAEAFRDELLRRATQGKTWRTVETLLPESWLKEAEAVFEKFGKAEDGSVAPPFLPTAAEMHVAAGMLQHPGQSRKEVPSRRSVEATGLQAAVLETASLIHTGRDRCARASPRGPCPRGRCAGRA